jgi:hypothetical protein
LPKDWTQPLDPYCENSRIGDTTEAFILAKLVAKGYHVLRPWSLTCPYDLAIDDNGTLVRIQCKTGRYHVDCIKFSTWSPGRGTYTGLVDYFGVYVPAIQKAYMVPISVVGQYGGRLRLQPVRNFQVKGVNKAEEYEI